jgi:dihydroorotate dehydrogenase
MYKLFRKFMFQLEAEHAHHITLSMLSKFPAMGRLLAHSSHNTPASLVQTLWGLSFPHPFGLAAGLDKNAEAVDGLFNCGFSYIEVGTVTPKPQPGNPKPRMFRLIHDEALINRMGFNNRGALSMAKSLASCKRPGIVGVNIGKNKVTPNEDALSDYISCLESLFGTADYIVLNVSSPNTPGLRDLQSEASIVPLVQAVLKKRDSLSSQSGNHCPPVLIKIAPDLADEAIMNLGRALTSCGIDGFIASNTTISRDGLQSPVKKETGGLSGRPLQKRSTHVIRLLFKATNGCVPIIGSGGVFDAADAYEKILAGASLVQVYTGFIYKGPALIGELIDGVSNQLKKDGFDTIQQAVGALCTLPHHS